MLRSGVLLVSAPIASASRAGALTLPPLAPGAPKGVHVRRATADDLPGVEALLSESALPLIGVREALPDFVVAEDAARQIVGVAGLEVYEEHALLRSVAVAREWRSRRLGRVLVEHIIADANARGLASVHLLTTTADRYFPSFGFRTVTRAEVPECLRAAEEFATACPATATVMRLECRRHERIASDPRLPSDDPAGTNGAAAADERTGTDGAAAAIARDSASHP